MTKRRQRTSDKELESSENKIALAVEAIEALRNLATHLDHHLELHKVRFSAETNEQIENWYVTALRAMKKLKGQLVDESIQQKGQALSLRELSDDIDNALEDTEALFQKLSQMKAAITNDNTTTKANSATNTTD